VTQTRRQAPECYVVAELIRGLVVDSGLFTDAHVPLWEPWAEFGFAYDGRYFAVEVREVLPDEDE
jgi:hypothetical protein